MPKFNLMKSKATDVVGNMFVLEVPTEIKKDAKTGVETYNAVIIFEGEEQNPITVKLTKKPEGLAKFNAIELYGSVMDCWGQASGTYVNLNWRATAFEMVKAGQDASKEFKEAHKQYTTPTPQNNQTR